MSIQNNRTALFIDFENLYTTLKNLQKQGIGDFGASPSIDFAALVEYVNRHIGTLIKVDTFAAANFSHYNQQLGGLNRLANIIHVDSFESTYTQSASRANAGKKFVMHNYSDMALAYHAGLHAGNRPADVYIFVTGDGAFAAVADCLKASGRLVNFILPDPQNAHHALKERYLCIPFQETQPRLPDPVFPDEITEEKEQSSIKPYQNAVAMIAEFRREFSTAIPASLIKAAIGPSSADRILNHARTEEEIDLWESNAGVACVSLRKERLHGTLIKMESRSGFVAAAGVIFIVANLAESTNPPADRATWRKHLKESLEISASEAKLWLNILLDTGILQDSRMKHPDLGKERLKSFLIRAEAQLSKENLNQ